MAKSIYKQFPNRDGKKSLCFRCSQSSGFNVIDFPLHYNFSSAGSAYGLAKSGDMKYNDATFIERANGKMLQTLINEGITPVMAPLTHDGKGNILILDEATAFADPDNEAKVQAAFARLAKGKTVLMIAHRLSTVANADCIYVVQDGRITETGTKDELCAQNGLFARMWQDYQASVQWKVACR